MTHDVEIRPASHSDAAIGRNVRILRNARNMAGEEFATRCGIGHHRFRKLEDGYIPFTIGLLCRVADVLDTTPGRLLDGPVTHRMIDLSGIADQPAAALETMANALRVPQQDNKTD